MSPSTTSEDIASHRPDFPYSRRLERLRQRLSHADLDGLIISDLSNLRWTTGFTGSSGTALVTLGEVVFVTDGRYELQVAGEVPAEIRAELVLERDSMKALAGRLSEVGRLGLEAETISWATLRRLEELLGQTGPELVATEAIIADLRVEKDAAEVACLKGAAAIADRALSEVAEALGSGMSERAFARLLENTMSDLGSHKPSFETIVASGPNSWRPHARPTERVIGKGDLVVVDFGASLWGYGSDMTRTFSIGAFSAEHGRLYDAVAEAQRAGVDAVQGGVELKEIDDTCRQVLARHGLGDAFVHGTGHGIGLDVHELPFLSPRSTGILPTGAVVTVEPGAYVEAVGGVRVEDSVLVTEDGCEPLTMSPKDPLISVA